MPGGQCAPGVFTAAPPELCARGGAFRPAGRFARPLHCVGGIRTRIECAGAAWARTIGYICKVCGFDEGSCWAIRYGAEFGISVGYIWDLKCEFLLLLLGSNCYRLDSIPNFVHIIIMYMHIATA